MIFKDKFEKVKEFLIAKSILNNWIISFDELVEKFWQRNARYWREKLEKKLILTSFGKGLYLINLWENPYFIIQNYMGYKKTNYYIGGVSLFNYYNITTQLANQYIVFNSEVNKEIKIWNVSTVFKKIWKEKLVGILVDKKGGQNILNKERLLIEVIYLGKQLIDIQEISLYFNKLDIKTLDLKLLLEYAKSFWSMMLRRVLAFLEYKGIDITIYLKEIKITSPISLLTRSRKGTITKQTQVILDFDIKEEWKIM